MGVVRSPVPLKICIIPIFRVRYSGCDIPGAEASIVCNFIAPFLFLISSSWTDMATPVKRDGQDEDFSQFNRNDLNWKKSGYASNI